ncbi:hypothetical protein DY000_02041432 [Brassica cretica]|uniref:Uncharacterized protein n=1 Tax=Brassica cretica TaxID=69181 RepID=A0ABQ7BMP5_BRACR|nr:hypothetical protein DY000_02041432 [Brassica cretica]
MSGVHVSRYTGLCMSVRMRRSQVLQNLVLLCVELHGTASCTSTPPSCVDTQQVKWLTPRPDPLDQATSSFSVDLRDFSPSATMSRGSVLIDVRCGMPIDVGWVGPVDGRVVSVDGRVVSVDRRVVRSTVEGECRSTVEGECRSTNGCCCRSM